jgi:hypothetical protein
MGVDFPQPPTRPKRCLQYLFHLVKTFCHPALDAGSLQLKFLVMLAAASILVDAKPIFVPAYKTPHQVRSDSF